MSRCATLVAYLATASGLMLSSSATMAQGSGDGAFIFHAALSGAQEVVPPDEPTTPSPGVDTAASAQVVVAVARDLSALEFQLVVNGGVGVTQAHLHCGRPGQNGPIILFLSPLNEQGADVNGVLAEGARGNADMEAGAAACEDLIGRPVRNIASLAAAAVDGLIYANVHTVVNPAGEVRGQLILIGTADQSGGAGGSQGN